MGQSMVELAKKAGLVSAALGLIATLSRAVVQAFKDTVLGLNAITIAGEVWKQMAYNLATVNININTFTASLIKAIGIGKLINEQRKEERKDIVICPLVSFKES